MKIWKRRVNDPALLLLASLDGVIFDKLAAKLHDDGWNCIPFNILRKSQINVSRGDSLDMKPHILLPTILEKLLVLVLVASHIHSEATGVRFWWERVEKYHVNV